MKFGLVIKVAGMCNILKFGRDSIFPSYWNNVFYIGPSYKNALLLEKKVFQNFVQERGNAVFVVNDGSNNEYELGNKVWWGIIK